MSVIDFAALPPEINSARMYAGEGAEPLVTAAAAWDSVAAELSSAASSYRAVVSGLTAGPWAGPSSISMAAAAAPYATWMSATAAQAEQTANQARSAVAAYEAAFVAIVPPPIIAENRAVLSALVATNIFGENGPAIAATEAQYAEMWTQDAEAMLVYAANSATATELTSFSPAPQTTNSAALATQAAAASQPATAQSLLSDIPQALQALSGAGGVNPLQAFANLINDFNGSPLGSALTPFLYSIGYDNTFLSGYTFLACGPLFMLAPLMAFALPNLGANGGLIAAAAAPAADVAGGAAALADATGSAASGVGAADLSAGLGRAASVGGLSVPQAWGSAAPEIQLATKALPMTSLDAAPLADAAGRGGWFGGLPPVGSLVNAPRTVEGTRYAAPKKVVAQMPGESGVAERTIAPYRPAADVTATAPSQREREELDQLRDELADLMIERDATARLIKEAMRP
jgi:PPE-repeat protein